MPSPFVGIDNPEKGGGVRISTPTTVPFTDSEFESVVKVVWVGNPPVASQSRKAGEDDEKQDDNFEDTEGVEETDTPLGQRRVQQDSECDAGDRDTARLPSVLRGRVVSVKDVTTECERVSGRETEKNHLGEQHRGCEQLGIAVYAFKVVLFTARAGNSETEFEEYAETSESQDTAWIGSECGQTVG